MKLSENFNLYEFIKSDTATKKGIVNIPGDAEIENLRKLCVRLLQPLRYLYSEAFVISSGYRNPELNKAVGGVANSQHVRGQASDIKVKEPRKLLAKLLESGLDFDQAILYQDGKNNFLHLSYNSGGNRQQTLYSKGTKP